MNSIKNKQLADVEASDFFVRRNLIRLAKMDIRISLQLLITLPLMVSMH
jgi:hypothetical protein